VLILPLSAVRLKTFHEEAAAGTSHVTPLETFVVAILFSLSGILNALLYGLTRAKFLWADERDEPKPPTIKPDQGLKEAANNPTSESGQMQ
jgi:hypothetical protein